MLKVEQNQNLYPRDLRQFLQVELLKRCEKNPSYSLRAFAKSLGIYHATLSALITGKRPVTPMTIKKLAEPLALSPQQVEAFLNAIKRKNSSSKKFQIPSSNDKYQELTLDTFVATSEWYYDGLLELTHLKDFRPDAAWIAKRLSITVSEVNIAKERLVRLELLSVDNENNWADLSRNLSTIVHNDFTSTALRKYQKKILELSSNSIDEVEKPLRDHTSMTVAIQKRDLHEVKELIRNFRRDLTSYLQREGVSPDEVYQLGISFFPLTKTLEKTGGKK